MAVDALAQSVEVADAGYYLLEGWAKEVGVGPWLVCPGRETRCVHMCVCARACACMCACYARACVRVPVCVCLSARGCTSPVCMRACVFVLWHGGGVACHGPHVSLLL